MTVRGGDEAVIAPFTVLATKTCGPSVSPGATVQVHAPIAFAVVVQTGVVPPSAKTETGAFGPAVPLTSGLESVSTAFWVGEVMTGATAVVLVSDKFAGVVTPATEAATWYGPLLVLLAVAVALTSPLAPVVNVPLMTADAPLEGGANVTVALGTGFPSASVTRTTRGAPNAEFTTVDCGVPLTTEMLAGAPALFVSANVACVTTPTTDAVTL